MPVPGVAQYMYSIVHDYTRTSSVGPVVHRVLRVSRRMPKFYMTDGGEAGKPPAM